MKYRNFRNRISKGLTYLAEILLIISICLIGGCRKFTEIPPPEDRMTQENVFADDQTAIAALSAIMSGMSTHSATLSKFAGLSADEFALWVNSDDNHFAYYYNSHQAIGPIPPQTTGFEIWESYYSYIYSCNLAIEGLEKSSSLTPAVKVQLLGEAHFLRAWFYFYLTNLYGEVPIAKSTDPEINRLLTRSTVALVYQFINEDLSKAKDFLSETYLDGSLQPYQGSPSERVRPTYWAAKALLSRISLFQRNYQLAELQSTEVINHTQLFQLPILSETFKKNNPEAIWQLQPVTTGWNTYDARVFNLSAIPSGLSVNKPVYMSSQLLAAFEPNDRRGKEWIGTYKVGSNSYFYPAKYKLATQDASINGILTITEYTAMLRLSEQFLIRAEARAHLNNISGSVADLDLIRQRAGLPLISNTNPAISQSELLDIIFKERQLELFSEWGHRWFDLKRTGAVTRVMPAITSSKGGTWEDTDQLLPIPFKELQTGVNLTQNKGY